MNDIQQPEQRRRQSVYVDDQGSPYQVPTVRAGRRFDIFDAYFVFLAIGLLAIAVILVLYWQLAKV